MTTRIIALIILTAWAVLAVCRVAAATAPGKAALAIYDKEVYELAYTVFLANSNLSDAFTLADAAVRQRPNDLVWRKRLAQLATWTQRPERALEQWLFIYDREKSDLAFNESIRFARSLNKDEILLKLYGPRLINKGTEPLWRNYIETSEQLGSIDEALKGLTAAAAKNPQPYLLEHLIRLSEQRGDSRQTLQYLDLLVERHGVTTKRALEQARLNYTHGNLQAALGNLRNARVMAKTEDISFWQTLGDIAWMLQDEEDIILAAQSLQGTPGERSVELERMIAILKDKKPAEAFSLARLGWVKHGTSFFYLNMLDIGVSLHSWQTLDMLFRGLTPQQQKLLYAAPYFWNIRLQTLESLHRKPEAVALCREAIVRFPDNNEFIVRLLWLLIELRERTALRQTLADYQQIAIANQALRSVFGSAYTFLDESEAALPFFAAEEKDRSGDLVWLVGYADLLDRTGHQQRAGEVRKHAWGLVQHGWETMATATGNREQLNAAVRLGLVLAPGDAVDALMSLVIKRAASEADREMILSWALATDRQDLARKWLKTPLDTSEPTPPPWVELALALRDNDRETLARMLDTKPADLPVRDRVEAAQRLGRFGEARELAYQGLLQEPQDDDLRQQYANLVVMTANRGELRTIYERRGPLEQVRTGISGRYSIWPTLQLTPSVTVITQKSTDPANLGQIPSIDNTGELGISLLTNGGEVAMSAGGRHAKNDVTTLRIHGESRLAAGFNLSLSLGVHQPAPESVPLLVGGMKDNLAGQLAWQLTNRDTLVLAAEGQLFSDQAGNRLGTGQKFALNYTNRLAATSPGIDFAGSLTAQSFTRSGTPGEAAAELIPQQQLQNAGFFIPRNFIQLDVGFYSDRSFVKSYIRRWKLFGGAGMVLNSVSGFGYSGELGAVGPLFGHDQLFVSLRQGNDHFGGSSSTITGEFWYTYFLSH